MDKFIQGCINVIFGISIIAGGYVLGLMLTDHSRYVLELIQWVSQ